MKAFSTVPLKFLAGINERSLPETTEPDRELRYVDIGNVGRGFLVSEPQVTRFGDAPSRARRLVKAGDTIVSTVRTYLRAVWPVTGDLDDLVVSTGFAVLSPTEINPRFFSWWIRSDLFIEEVVARSVGVSYPAINALDLGRLPVRVPPLAAQRSIADFLDTETARIDALITKKRRMIERLVERRTATRAATFTHVGRWRLKHVLHAPMAYGVLVPRFVEQADGVPMARIGALDPDGTIAADRLAYIDPVQGIEYRRTKTVAGDLVLSVVGSMGRAAVVDDAVAGTNTNRPLARLQPDARLPARLLWHWVQTDLFLDQARLATGGDTAQPTLNLGDLAQFETGLPPDPDEWAPALDRLEAILAPPNAVLQRLERQIALLQEHRQALVTAAVTGELEIPGVAA